MKQDNQGDKLVADAADMRFSCGRNGELYVQVEEEDFQDTISSLADAEFVLISLFCVQDFGGHAGFTLMYAFEKRGEPRILVLERRLKGSGTSSIEELYPTACWYEREIHDGFGVTFQNAFDLRRLMLHDMYPDDFHPLLKSFKNGKVRTKEHITKEQEYAF
jgi:formate hydrogenlyase subunit 5